MLVCYLQDGKFKEERHVKVTLEMLDFTNATFVAEEFDPETENKLPEHGNSQIKPKQEPLSEIRKRAIAGTAYSAK